MIYNSTIDLHKRNMEEEKNKNYLIAQQYKMRFY
jgi:hypothetical protein